MKKYVHICTVFWNFSRCLIDRDHNCPICAYVNITEGYVHLQDFSIFCFLMRSLRFQSVYSWLIYECVNKKYCLVNFELKYNIYNQWSWMGGETRFTVIWSLYQRRFFEMAWFDFLDLIVEKSICQSHLKRFLLRFGVMDATPKWFAWS